MNIIVMHCLFYGGLTTTVKYLENCQSIDRFCGGMFAGLGALGLFYAYPSPDRRDFRRPRLILFDPTQRGDASQCLQRGYKNATPIDHKLEHYEAVPYSQTPFNSH